MKTRHNKITSYKNKIGLPPGVLLPVEVEGKENVSGSVIKYNKDCFERFDSLNKKLLDQIREDTSFFYWVNLNGLSDISQISLLGEIFDLHPLLQEDILNTQHRPKLEDYEQHIFVTIKMLDVDKLDNSVTFEQISLILGPNWVITFQEVEGDIFSEIRERLSQKIAPIIHLGADYLFYRLLDTIIDHYYSVTEFLNDSILALENDISKDPDEKTLAKLQDYKKEVLFLSNYVSSARSVVSTLSNINSPLIKKRTAPYINDVHDHIVHVNETFDTQRELLNNAMDFYHSRTGQKMNEIMKVLTIIATIFIPLTFIAGVYGMNFDNMPELHWKYSYYVAWGVMLLLFIIMLIFFKRKKWL